MKGNQVKGSLLIEMGFAYRERGPPPHMKTSSQRKSINKSVRCFSAPSTTTTTHPQPAWAHNFQIRQTLLDF